MGLSGACRSNELHDMTVNDIRGLNTAFLVTAPVTKTKTARTFTVTKEFYQVVEKKLNLRRANLPNDFFVNLQKGNLPAKEL